MKYLKLKMDFDGIVSRTVVVPSDWSLAFLHGVIQAVFGWLDYHEYEFTIPGDAQKRRWTEQSGSLDDFGDGKYLESSETPISALVARKGAKIDYTYDFGDCNDVEITLLGTVAKPSPKEFATEGPDVVEDSAGVGGIAGIVALAKQGKGKEYKQVSEWLLRAFKKRIDDVLDYPSVRDIYTRVFSLVKTASTANPKSVSTCWLDYLVVR
jgi:hypothetical protein